MLNLIKLGSVVRTKFDQAKKQAKMLGGEEGTAVYRNVFKQIFAKLIVGGRTIGKNMDTGKTYVVGKPSYQLGRIGKLI
jgi:hypothetical protein